MAKTVFIAVLAISGAEAGLGINNLYSIYKISTEKKPTAQNLLNRALKRQGINKETNKFKEKWSDKDGYDYEVRIKEKDANAPPGSNSASGRILRVSRRKQGLDENNQGHSWESVDGKGNWFK